MIQARSDLPKGWKWERLGNPYVAEIIMGQSPPSSTYNSDRVGLAFYQGKADFGDINPIPRVWCNQPKKIAESGDLLLSVRAPVGSTNIANERCCIGRGLAAIRGTNKLITTYLYFWLKHREEWLSNQGEGSTFKAIGKERISSLLLPLPQLPVQERIVEILQKADEIRRKRQEALAIFDKFTTSFFDDFFVNHQNTSQWETKTVESVLREKTTNGKSPSKKQDFCEAQVLTLSAVRKGRINLNERKLATFDIADVSKYYIKQNDAFIVRGNGNINLVGRMGFYDDKDTNIVYPDTLIRVRFNNEIVLNEFMQYLWDTYHIRHQIEMNAKTTSGTYKINQNDIKNIEFLCPPIQTQQQLLSVANSYVSNIHKQGSSEKDIDNLFNSLLSRAFTGELTAEWEQINAEYIANRQQYYQRLPQLTLLSFLQQRQTTTLVTELMKYVFLLQMEGTTQQRYYQFIPYHYGPFAEDLYRDLETLQQQGAIAIDQSEKEKTKISLSDTKTSDRALSQLPAEIQADIATILNQYGDLNLNELLDTVYQKYPTYAKKSKRKRQTKKKVK
ncbi:MAG: restriction endonuclease subunit S [Cyanobacteria bacterium P01_E01_bin.42]